MLLATRDGTHESRPEIREHATTVTVPLAPEAALAAAAVRSTAPRRRRGWLVRRALLVADVVGLALAFFVAELVIELTKAWPVRLEIEALLFAATIPVWVTFAKLYGLYDRDEERTNHTTVDDLVGVFHLCTVGIWLLFVAAWLTDLSHPPLKKVILFWITALVLVACSRSLARTLCRRSSRYLQNTLVVGAGRIGQLVGRKLLQHEEYGLRLVGFVDSQPIEQRPDLAGVNVLGPVERLPELVRELAVERVIVAFSRDSHDTVLEAVRGLNELDVQIDIVPRLFELVGPSVEIHNVEAVPLVGLPPPRLSPSSRLIKRAVDLTFAAAALILTAPLFAYIAFRLKRDSPGPILFRQERLGLNMRPFTVLKFRTMRTDVDQQVHQEFVRAATDRYAAPTANGLYKLARDDAVTTFGHWLRKTSLDELPQLINVLRGEMSLVGPRPCIAYELENFAPHHFDRFLVPPGLTGLWQVTARAYSSFGEALDMDVAYVRGWSLGLDLWLLLRTPLEVLRAKATA
jgi:exopolysaccharide biosynthesis polyprenyl glycosylphosphotransferase